MPYQLVFTDDYMRRALRFLKRHPELKAQYAKTLALLEAHGEPLLGSSLILAGDDEPLLDIDDIMQRVAGRVDLVIDAPSPGVQPTTVIDMTGDTPQVMREGRGPIDRMI